MVSLIPPEGCRTAEAPTRHSPQQGALSAWVEGSGDHRAAQRPGEGSLPGVLAWTSAWRALPGSLIEQAVRKSISASKDSES